MAKRKRRSFSSEFKAEAVRLCKVGNRSIGQIARDLDLTETALWLWVRQAEIEAGNGPPEGLTTSEREELWRLRRENKRLQMEREILNSRGLLREGEQVKFAFIAAEKVTYPVEMLCNVLEVSRSGYYAWVKRAAPMRAKADTKLAVEVAAVHRRSRASTAARACTRSCAPGAGAWARSGSSGSCGPRSLVARQKRRFLPSTGPKHALPLAPNVLDRHFRARASTVVWVTDVTYITTDEGWMYLAVTLDLFSWRVVGWAASEINDRTLALQPFTASCALVAPRQGWCITPTAAAHMPATTTTRRCVNGALWPHESRRGLLG